MPEAAGLKEVGSSLPLHSPLPLGGAPISVPIFGAASFPVFMAALSSDFVSIIVVIIFLFPLCLERYFPRGLGESEPCACVCVRRRLCGEKRLMLRGAIF